MKRYFKIAACLLAGSFSIPSAMAVLTINFAQSGPDVEITATGTLDISGLPTGGLNFGATRTDIYSDIGFQNIWSLIPGADYYKLPFSHDFFSNTFPLIGGVGAGDKFGLVSWVGGGDAYIYVADGFTSGMINGSLTLPSTNLATLGVNNLATSTWGASPGQALAITGGAAVVVPETSTYIAFAGFAGLGLILWVRRAKPKSKQAE